MSKTYDMFTSSDLPMSEEFTDHPHPARYELRQTESGRETKYVCPLCAFCNRSLKGEDYNVYRDGLDGYSNYFAVCKVCETKMDKKVNKKVCD